MVDSNQGCCAGPQIGSGRAIATDAHQSLVLRDTGCRQILVNPELHPITMVLECLRALLFG